MGGTAIMSSRTRQVVGADVWFCGLPENVHNRDGPRPNASMVDRVASRVNAYVPSRV